MSKILNEDKIREKFAEVLSKEAEEESFDEFMINLISEKNSDN
jgi:ribosomal protein S3AE